MQSLKIGIDLRRASPNLTYLTNEYIVEIVCEKPECLFENSPNVCFVAISQEGTLELAKIQNSGSLSAFSVSPKRKLEPNKRLGPCSQAKRRVFFIKILLYIACWRHWRRSQQRRTAKEYVSTVTLILQI
jgi:hypothetical protein